MQDTYLDIIVKEKNKRVSKKNSIFKKYSIPGDILLIIFEYLEYFYYHNISIVNSVTYKTIKILMRNMFCLYTYDNKILFNFPICKKDKKLLKIIIKDKSPNISSRMSKEFLKMFKVKRSNFKFCCFENIFKNRSLLVKIFYLESGHGLIYNIHYFDKPYSLGDLRFHLATYNETLDFLDCLIDLLSSIKRNAKKSKEKIEGTLKNLKVTYKNIEKRVSKDSTKNFFFYILLKKKGRKKNE